MQPKDFLALRKESTWAYFFKSLFTLGIYNVFWLKDMSARINALPFQLKPLSSALVSTLVAAIYVNAVCFIIFLVDKDNLVGQVVGDLASLTMNICLIVWAFKARNRINQACSFSKDEHQYWFHGFWAFIFTSIYINYRINCVSLQVETELDNSSSSQDA